MSKLLYSINNNITEQLQTFLFSLSNVNLLNITVDVNDNYTLDNLNNNNRLNIYNVGLNNIINIYNYYKFKNDDNFVKPSYLINLLLSFKTNKYFEMIYYKSDISTTSTTPSISTTTQEYFNSNISYSIQLEKEINRFLYYYTTTYAKEFIKVDNVSLYKCVKMYKGDGGGGGVQDNLYIYQNQKVLQLFNINLFNDSETPLQNSYFIDFISNLRTEPFEDFSYYYYYKIFYTFITNESIDIKLENGDSAFNYFILNIDSFNDYVYNFITLKEYYSPYYIYSDIINYVNNEKDISVNFALNKNNVALKIVIYLYMIYLINSNIGKIITSNLQFASATFFIIKLKIFNVFTIDKIEHFYKNLNNQESLDYYWYSVFYNMNINNKQNIYKDYMNNQNTKYPNNIKYQVKTNKGGLRDCMIEHAFERLFGYVCKKNGFDIVK